MLKPQSYDREGYAAPFSFRDFYLFKQIYILIY